MTPWTGFRIGSALSLTVLAACAKPWPADLEQVVHPDLASAEAAVRDQVAVARQPLTALLERGRGDTVELAEAFGRLGEIYHAYDLYEAAGSCYVNARRLAPGDPGWSRRFGLAAAAAGDFVAAAAAFAEARSRGDDDPALRLRLGQVRLALGEIEAARELLATLVADPAYASAARFALARAALAAGDTTAAVELLRAVVDAQPGAGAARHALAEARRRLGQAADTLQHDEPDEGTTAAEPTFPDPLADRILDLARSSGAYLQRGNRALVAGRTDEAVAALRKSVALDPESMAGRRNLALALRRQGDAAGAVAELEAALTIVPGEPQTLFDLGNARLELKDRDGALEAFRKAVERAPEMTRARFNLANVLAGLGRWGEAEEELRAVLTRDPGDRRAAYLLAIAAHQLGRSDEASSRLEALLSEDPSDLTVRRGLVAVLGARGRRDRAVALVEEALAGELPVADRQALLLDLAEAARLARRPAEGISHAVLAVELDPGRPSAWLAEANLRFAAGDWSAARTRLEEALARHPGHVGLTHALAGLLATCPEDGVRDGARALALAQAVHGREPSLEHALTVGMALAESGDLAGAIRWHTGLAEQAERQHLAPALQRQIAAQLRFFEAGRPVRAGAPIMPSGS